MLAISGDAFGLGYSWALQPYSFYRQHVSVHSDVQKRTSFNTFYMVLKRFSRAGSYDTKPCTV